MILSTLVISQLHFEMCAGLYGHPVLDFILRFLMRRWISYASVGARNNELFEFICLIKCL